MNDTIIKRLVVIRMLAETALLFAKLGLVYEQQKVFDIIRTELNNIKELTNH